jgi:hypothetical protein
MTRSRLILKDIKLNVGLVKALALTINEMIDFKMKYLYFENNGIDDECFPTFLDCLKERYELASAMFINNDLGPKTVKVLISLMEELTCYKFEELKLANCKILIPMG